MDSGLKFVNGVCFSPDQTQLYAAESAGHWITGFLVVLPGWDAGEQAAVRVAPHAFLDDTGERVAGWVEV